MHLVDITMFYAAEGGGVSTYLNAKADWLAHRSRVRHTILSPNVSSNVSPNLSPNVSPNLSPNLSPNVAASGSPTLVRIPSFSLPGINGYRMPLSVASAARLLRAAEPDLIEAGDAGQCAWAALRMQQRLGIPAVAFYHSDLPRLLANRFGKLPRHIACKYLAQLYRQFDIVLAPSRLMVQQLAAMGVTGAVHQPLGIDSSLFHPGQRLGQLRQQLKLAQDARLLVYAGRFTAEKKLDVLIEAVRKLGRPYHLVLIGGGAELPRDPQITYIRFQRDQRQLARLLASCDVLVHPGDCETFGLIVLEAMACALPVIGTSGGGVAELVDEQSGILAQPNSVASLAEAIAAMYQRDRASVGAHARRKAQEQYDWGRILPQLLNRYAGLLASRERAELEAEGICVTD